MCKYISLLSDGCERTLVVPQWRAQIEHSRRAKDHSRPACKHVYVMLQHITLFLASIPCVVYRAAHRTLFFLLYLIDDYASSRCAQDLYVYIYIKMYSLSCINSFISISCLIMQETERMHAVALALVSCGASHRLPGGFCDQDQYYLYPYWRGDENEEEDHSECISSTM